MVKKDSWLLPLLLLATGCIAPAETASPASAGAPTPNATDPVLAQIDGVPIHRSNLDPEIERELKSIDNEAKQRSFHMLWAGVDEAINRSLMHREAARRDVSVEDLRAQEVYAKAVEPADEEVRAAYDTYKEQIGVPFEMAAPILKRQLLERRRKEQEQAFVERLRSAADVRHAVPVPELPRFDIEAGDSPSRGSDRAGVTLIEFSDFQCPYCGQARKMLEELAARYPNDMRIVFRDFPLRQHPRAQAAAEAAHCAHEQDKFWPYHDLLFANASDLEDSALDRYAEEAKLDLAEFTACLQSERPKTAVAANKAAGERYGIEGTPAIFINGIKLIGLLPLPLMQALIDRELGR
jgi:predicted DsbA family dithiol-disulfide isomerase